MGRITQPGHPVPYYFPPLFPYYAAPIHTFQLLATLWGLCRSLWYYRRHPSRFNTLMWAMWIMFFISDLMPIMSIYVYTGINQRGDAIEFLASPVTNFLDQLSWSDAVRCWLAPGIDILSDKLGHL
ncbi:hypothetical protein HDV00_010216 [Rhizophlyctis rosea]|nr:hypothetical protein HDV00_010216 [Rhizophlyctis rosea]